MPDLPTGALPELPAGELPDLPAGELPDVPALPDVPVPDMPVPGGPPIPELPGGPALPDVPVPDMPNMPPPLVPDLPMVVPVPILPGGSGAPPASIPHVLLPNSVSGLGKGVSPSFPIGPGAGDLTGSGGAGGGMLGGIPLAFGVAGAWALAPPLHAGGVPEYWGIPHPIWPRVSHFGVGFIGGTAIGGQFHGQKCVCEHQPEYNPFDVRHVALFMADKALRCAWKARVMTGMEWYENSRCKDMKCHGWLRWPFKPSHA